MGRRSKSLVLFFVMFLVGCDHATKLVAERALTEGARVVTVVPGLLDLRYMRNENVAFSLLQGVDVPGKAWLIVAFASIATLAVLFGWYQRRMVASRAEHFAWAAIASGAIANVVDRAARGYVVDFLRLPHWPVFNVADVCIVAGVLGLLLARRRDLTHARVSG